MYLTQNEDVLVNPSVIIKKTIIEAYKMAVTLSFEK
jgi:hypothetical protein